MQVESFTQMVQKDRKQLLPTGQPPSSGHGEEASSAAGEAAPGAHSEGLQEQGLFVLRPEQQHEPQARALEWKVAPCTGKVDLSANGHVHCRCIENLWDMTLQRHSLKNGHVQKTGN